MTLTRCALRFGDLPYIEDRDGGPTDANGHFVLERLPPVECSVSARLTPWEKYPITSSQSVPLDLQPGQTVTLNLGGDGAQVTGQVKLAGKQAGDFDLSWSLNYLLCKTPGIELPAALRTKDFDWRDGWNNAWTDTQEGNTYRSTLPHYFVRLNSDGALLISGVPAGDYELALRIYEHKDPNACMVKAVGSKIVRFQVTASDVAKGTIDLGKIEVDAGLGPTPGETVPDFEFETIEGTRKQLSDLRGQYVLLDFWATWCNSCVAALPQVRTLHDKYGNDGKLTVIGVSLDIDKPAAREFIRQRNLFGTQAFLNEGPESKTLIRLGISSIPTYVLISPDGKLILKGFSIDEVKEKLAASIH